MEFFTNPLVYGGFCFFLGVLVTSFVVHILTKDRERQSRQLIIFNEAALKFRSVIAREIATTGINTDEASMSTIETALIEFKPHLTAEKQEQIEKTWQKLITLENNRSTQKAFYGYSMGASIRKELLEELLKFTE